MNDLISRQAAIDAIFGEPLYESGMKKRDADAVVPAIYEKIKSLPSAQPKVLACGEGILEAKDERWIPTSERLPELPGHYLTTTEFGEVYCDFWNCYEFGRTENVIAWMPMPKPY